MGVFAIKFNVYYYAPRTKHNTLYQDIQYDFMNIVRSIFGYLVSHKNFKLAQCKIP